MSTQPAIVVKNLKKSFRIPLDGNSGIKQKILNIFKRSKGYRVFTPLNDVSFTIEEGDFFGIVGRNGSGKSTLLKTIAGIYTPDDGYVKVNGALVPFIELGVGFNPELTGRENVYLNGALLGFSRDEITAMYDKIVDFAELHDFMEEQLKNYSSGMQVRLAFSIAIRAEAEILLLDEVLAVGDSAFQQKCYDYFEKLKREKRTIILVTHSMDAVKRFCNKALLIENGKIKLAGGPEEVGDQYLLDNISSSEINRVASATKDVGYFHAEINSSQFSRSDVLSVDFEYKLENQLNVYLGISIVNNGRSVAEINSMGTHLPSEVDKLHKAKLDVPLEVLNPGEYSLNVSIFMLETREILSYVVDVDKFIIKGNDPERGGVVYIDGKWQISNDLKPAEKDKG